MPPIKIFWDPAGFELDQLGSKKYMEITDGDTPYISLAIRMLSIDAPETHYPGQQKPHAHDANLQELAAWIQQGKAPVPDGLAAYLYPRLATGTAGTLQGQQGENAKAALNQLLDEKLTRPNGGKRRMFLWASQQHFDQYGRLLAYMAPTYESSELAHMSRHDRATFNLLLVEAGWAASFPIYPDLPRYADLVLLRAAAQSAFEQHLGIWSDPLTMAGYEFRMCIRLHETTKKIIAGQKLQAADKIWVERYCADMTTLEIYEPEDYYCVPAYNRIFIWPQDVQEAVGRLNLTPGG